MFEDGPGEDAKWTGEEREQASVPLRKHPRWKEFDTIMFTWVLYKNSPGGHCARFEARKSTWERGPSLTAETAEGIGEKVLSYD